MALCLLPKTAHAAQSDESLSEQLRIYSAGTAEKPFLIKTAQQLADLAQKTNAGLAPYYDAYYQMVDHIDLSVLSLPSEGWTPIGAENVQVSSEPSILEDKPFAGVFDGQGYEVRGLAISRLSGQQMDRRDQGLFGFVNGTLAKPAQVKNVIVVNASIVAYQRIGAVVGVLGKDVKNTAVLTGCAMVGGSVEGRPINSDTRCDCVGGVVGSANGKVADCYATGSVNGQYLIGGVVGCSNDTVSNCYATGDVGGVYNIGGVVGLMTGTVSNCYATGNVIGRVIGTGVVIGDVVNIGGVAGTVVGSITNCTALGSAVSGTDKVGRVAGEVSGSISGAFAWKDMMVTEGSVGPRRITDGTTTNKNGADTDQLSVTVMPAATLPQGNAPLTAVTAGAGVAGFNATKNFASAEMGPEGGTRKPLIVGTDCDVADGSIILTLHPSYLNTLVPGVYTLRINLKGTGYPAYVQTRITVTVPGGDGGGAGPDVPKTGDSSLPGLWAGLALLAGTGIIALRRKRRA